MPVLESSRARPAGHRQDDAASVGPFRSYCPSRCATVPSLLASDESRSAHVNARAAGDKPSWASRPGRSPWRGKAQAHAILIEHSRGSVSAMWGRHIDADKAKARFASPWPEV